MFFLKKGTEHNGKKLPYDLTLFDSLSDMLHPKHTKSRSPKGKRIGAWNRSSWIGYKGLKSMDDVRKAIIKPWDEGGQILDEMLEEIRSLPLPQPESRRRKRTWSANGGDELSIDRLKARKENIWDTRERRLATGPMTVTIVVSVGANCHVKPKPILWRGVAALVIARMLEDAGYRCEIWAAWRTDNCYHGEGGSYVGRLGQLIGTKVKDLDEYLDEMCLISAVSAWAYRTAFFGVLAANPLGREPYSTLGHSVEPNDQDVSNITPDEHRIIIRDAFDRNQAIAAIKEALSRFDLVEV